MDYAIMDDAQLVVQVWKRDNDAFRELAIRYHKLLFQLIRGLISNPEDAEDCSQEALFRAYLAMTNRKKPDDPEKFWPYIKQIARNAAMDIHRDRHRDRLRAEELSERLGSEAVDDANRYVESREMIGKLPESERTVIWLYYFEGYGVDEIAETLGHKQPWVSKKKVRGENLLRKMWRR